MACLPDFGDDTDREARATVACMLFAETLHMIREALTDRGDT